MRPHEALIPLATLALTAIFSAASAETNIPAPIFPKALRPGDTIMFIAPAKYLAKKEMTLARKRLQQEGFQVRVPETLFRKKGFLAGTDDERAAELMAAFSDSSIAAIFPGTGGYGTTRIVDKLDYDVIRRNPKIFIGFSDITALHVAINQRTGLVTFHTPNPETALGKKRALSPFAAKWFWRAPLAKNYPQNEIATIASETRPTSKLTNSDGSGGGSAGYTIQTNQPDTGKSGESSIPKDERLPKLMTFSKGTARGRLIGGNLSVVHALMGTAFEIQTKGRILLLEDVGEAPYRVDRMLSTLKLAGKFDDCAGIVLGQFTARKDDANWDDDATVDDVLRDYFAKLNVPVLGHFPVGHVRYNATLPIGAMFELDATGQTLRLLENPISQ